jgi:hypothetical protein
MPLRPTELRVTILDTPEDLMWFHLDYGQFEDADGNVTLRDGEETITVPLKGLYRVERLVDGLTTAGPGFLMTKEQFEAKHIEFEEPYFEYGVSFLPRRNDIVTHGSLDAAKAALSDAPILLASGNYGIVRRLTHEPGDWELVPDVTFDGADAA